MLAVWRQFWPTLRSGLTEFLVYALVTSVLTGLLGFGVSLVPVVDGGLMSFDAEPLTEVSTLG